ncbi:MAG: hypothetical protein R2724_28080 [Bryobacterales bacterium]
MLADGVATARGRARRYLHRDQISELRPRRASVSDITSGSMHPRPASTP